MKKKIWLGVGLVVLLAAIIWGVVWGPQTFSFYWYEYLNRKHLAEFEAIEETYRTDTNGGETPEETLDLFVSALEDGDAGLAASYFVPEKRGEMGDTVKNWEKNNRLEFIIEMLKSITFEQKNIDGEMYLAEVMNQNKEVELSVSFLKNQHSQKWLIESL